MKFNELTMKQQRQLNNKRKDFYDDADFEDYKKNVLHALSRKPARRTLKNSGMTLEIHYIFDDGLLGLKATLYAISGKCLWTSEIYYDYDSSYGELDGSEPRAWLIEQAYDILEMDISDDEDNMLIRKIIS